MNTWDSLALPVEDKRGAVLWAVEKAVVEVLDADRQRESALRPSVQHTALGPDTIRLRIHTGRREYRITVEAVRP